MLSFSCSLCVDVLVFFETVEEYTELFEIFHTFHEKTVTFDVENCFWIPQTPVFGVSSPVTFKMSYTCSHTCRHIPLHTFHVPLLSVLWVNWCASLTMNLKVIRINSSNIIHLTWWNIYSSELLWSVLYCYSYLLLQLLYISSITYHNYVGFKKETFFSFHPNSPGLGRRRRANPRRPWAVDFRISGVLTDTVIDTYTMRNMYTYTSCETMTSKFFSDTSKDSSFRVIYFSVFVKSCFTHCLSCLWGLAWTSLDSESMSISIAFGKKRIFSWPGGPSAWKWSTVSTVFLLFSTVFYASAGFFAESTQSTCLSSPQNSTSPSILSFHYRSMLHCRY